MSNHPKKEEIMSEENVVNCCAIDAPSTWRRRLMAKLFPIKHCFAPEAPAHYKDCINMTAVTKLSFIDRLRCLFTGVVVQHSRIVTEHEVGNTVSASECYIGTKRDMGEPR